MDENTGNLEQNVPENTACEMACMCLGRRSLWTSWCMGKVLDDRRSSLHSIMVFYILSYQATRMTHSIRF